jgi:hypothetical protein
MNSKIKRKGYSISLPFSLVNRLLFIKRLKKGEVDMGKESTGFFYKLIDELEKKNGINNESWKKHKKCPQCDSYLIIKKGKRGDFYGCYNYPNCKCTESIYQSKKEEK